VSPAPVVVAFDPEECVLLDVGEVVPGWGVDEFFLVGCEERFGDGVVETGGAATHGAAHAVDSTELSEFFGGVLATAVAVENNTGWGFAGRQCPDESFDDRAGPLIIGDGVTDHLPRVQVDHRGGEDPPVDGLDVADVAAPPGVGLLAGEVLADQVRGVDGTQALGR